MAELYAVSGETLTGIADAIRSKTGSDDFMTVASMASAIEGISAGGGLPAKISKIWYGTAIGIRDWSLTIPHELGEVPDMILYWCEDIQIKPNADLNANVCGFKTYTVNPERPQMGGITLSVRTSGNPSSAHNVGFDSGLGHLPTAEELTIGSGSSSYMLADGYTYHIIAIKLNTEE